MKLKPLGNAFIFQFTSGTYGGQFVERNSGQIILTNQDLSEQGKWARWGKVLAVGDDVETFAVGDYVLIEALKWTSKMLFEGDTFWKSDEEKVIAIGEDESVTYAF